MTKELRDKARTLGLDRLSDEHLRQFERATTGMERHLQRLPRGMPAAQEPAHVYRAKGALTFAARLARSADRARFCLSPIELKNHRYR